MSLATRQRKRQNSARVNLVVSVAVHTVAVLAVGFLAAREGLLGERFKEFAVTIVAKEKQPEAPEEKPQPVEDAKPEPEGPAAADPPPGAPEAPRVSAPPPAERVGSGSSGPVAPPAAVAAGFRFPDGARARPQGSDAVGVYRAIVQYTLETAWVRPRHIDAPDLLVEAEVSIDATGRLAVVSWPKLSGNADWDNSVRRVFESNRVMRRPPPPGFPSSFRIRFDVVEKAVGPTSDTPAVQ